MTTAVPPLAGAPARPLIMGVVNVTPDSFSDGGRWFEPAAAIEHGSTLLEQGADLLDIGGESTRPGAERPSEQEELDRVIGVVRVLAAQGATISVDTMRARVAAEALEAGATLINDVSGGLADAQMAPLVVSAGVPFVAMHWRAHSAHMDREAQYADVLAEVVGELCERVDQLLAAGLTREAIILDPGFGFSKNADHNWELLAGLDAVTALGHRVLVGTSRKRFLGRLGPEAGPDTEPTPPAERDAATAATSLLAAQAGAWAVRVHDVPSTRDALAVWERVRGAGSGQVEHTGGRVSTPEARVSEPEARAHESAARVSESTARLAEQSAAAGTPDRITLTGVSAYGYHGVLESEKADGQEFSVDLVLEVDLSRAAASDDLRHTVNYAEVAADVVAILHGPSQDLIETVAGQIAEAALARPLVEAVTVTLHKPHAPVGVPFGDVTVQVRRERSVPVVIALGANLGSDPAETLQQAAERLGRTPGITDVRVSPLFETDPVGGPEQQPTYVNAVALARTSLAPWRMLAVLHGIEAEFGRTREIRWGARTLDLDLIQVGQPGEVSEALGAEPDLMLPHPRAHERGFVLAPWHAIDEAAHLRVGDRVVPVADLLAVTGTEGVRQRG